jgi:glycosyltransferase involved in cell wall biosynthesis
MPAGKLMKVLFVIPNMEGGGAERVMLNLLRHIDRSRFEPHLALLEARGAYLQSLPQDVEIHNLGVSSARFAVLPIAKLCWKIRPRAVLSMLAYMNSAVIASRPLLPKPIRLLTREGTRTTTREVTRSRLRRWSYKQFYRRADIVICQSEFMKGEMQREFGLAPEKLTRIYNPVDIDLVTQLAREGDNPFPNAGPHLLSVGRLSKEKGLDLLLRALPLIRAAIPAVQLTMLGEGPLEATLKSQASQLGLESCVRFVGFQGNPYPFLRHAHVLVLPSQYEGLPNAVLEALALGTFVVATNCTGAVHEIAHTTRRMRIACEHTPESLAAVILESLPESLSAPKLSGPEPEFEARFGMTAVMAQYEHLLCPTVDRPPQALTAEERSEFKLAAK